jgi:glycosyltransferase involved in cell wall biosynthesis
MAEPVLPLGVNLAGYLDATVGVGESARNVAAALEAAGVAVAPLPLSSRDAPRGPAALRAPAAHPITLVCANPDGMTGARDELGADAFEGRHVVGLWWWEVSALPERWLRAFDLVDEVWAGSRFVADVFGAVAPVPVVHVPLPVRAPVASDKGRAQLGLAPGPFLFGFVYDYASVAARKNPLGLIEAFARAFAGGDDGVALVLKTLGGDRHPVEHGAVLAAAAEHERVTVVDDHLSTEDKNALIRELDCYVSLHRSEGFGLTIAEAMLLGTPVIATDYGGSRDIATPFNALLVDARPVAIGPGHEPYPERGEWGEPDLDHAAAQMRAARADPAAGRDRAQRARADIVARHAPAAAGRAMADRLARVLSLPLDGAGRTTDLDLEAVRARMATGPRPAPGRAAGARAAVRDAALRAMRPYTVHQRLVDEELLRALQSLDERVRGLATGQQALAAEIARLRREDDA